ncbi:MAG TPA: hypothetical protein V6C58_21230 [Allocoleopsis sp.]
MIKPVKQIVERPIKKVVPYNKPRSNGKWINRGDWKARAAYWAAFEMDGGDW